MLSALKHEYTTGDIDAMVMKKHGKKKENESWERFINKCRGLKKLEVGENLDLNFCLSCQ